MSSIKFCLISNKVCPLVEYQSEIADKTSKMSTIANQLVQGLPYDQDSREALDCDGNTFSYMVEDELAFVCVTDSSFGQRSALLFLMHIKKLFDAQFGERGRATKLKLDLNHDFIPILKEQMKQFSPNSNGGKLDDLKRDMDMVKNSMQDNIGKVLERGDKVELLVDKTDSLNSQSEAFAKSSRTLRRQLWLQNMKILVCGGLALVAVIALLVYHFKK